MKAIIILLALFSFSYSNQYVFLLDKNYKEIELEAKIIAKIATASLKERAKIYIPNISKQEQKIYSKYFNLVLDCKSANFIFDKKGRLDPQCKNVKKLFFTSNYKRLILNDKYYGAFFWNKSRPNIVFVKQRLKNSNIVLSDEYAQYIEELNEL